ncbi:Uncharacterized protein Rs2_12528 [Raphanus sativus]|nr:Uncharacterized protein Rs2_12528 [Raphanus sativus]
MKATNPAVVSSGSVNPVVHPGISSGDVNSVRSKKGAAVSSGPGKPNVQTGASSGVRSQRNARGHMSWVRSLERGRSTDYDEKIAREAALSSQVHFLEQRVQMLEEEIETQKKLNAQLED